MLELTKKKEIKEKFEKLISDIEKNNQKQIFSLSTLKNQIKKIIEDEKNLEEKKYDEYEKLVNDIIKNLNENKIENKNNILNTIKYYIKDYDEFKYLNVYNNLIYYSEYYEIIQNIFNEKEIKNKIPYLEKMKNNKFDSYYNYLTSLFFNENDFEQKYERTPTTKELEALTELSEDKISKLIEYSKYTVSIDTPFSDDEEAGTLVDIIPNHNSTNTDEALIKESNTNQILSILNLLRDREHDILRLYYGINVRQMNMEEIGELFGISAERVRQIKKKALDMLREDYSKELSNILYGTA
jgi:hypothetical protein